MGRARPERMYLRIQSHACARAPVFWHLEMPVARAARVRNEGQTGCRVTKIERHGLTMSGVFLARTC